MADKPKPISIKTASEIFIGRLTLLHKRDPVLAQTTLERVIRMMQIATGDADVRKTYQIELKIDFDDPARHRAMLKVMRKQGRNVLTAAMLLMDNREPQIAISTDDFFEGGTKEALREVDDEAGDGVVHESHED